MAKVNLTAIGSGYALQEAYNANNDAIEAAFDNTVSRDGSTPNHMQADLDMNSNRILNLPDGSAAGDPVTKRQLDSAATGTLLSYSASNGNYTAPGSGTTRAINGKLDDWITPDDYGCAGDGSTDDTTNFSLAVLGALSADTALFIPPGRTYVIGGYTIALDNVVIVGEGTLKAKTGADMLTVSGDDFKLIGPTLDLTNLNGTNTEYDALVISGDRPVVDITANNLTCNTTATSGTISAVNITGADAHIKVKARNHTQNAGAGNGSFPRVVNVGAAAVDAHVEIWGRDVNCGVVMGTGTTRPVCSVFLDTFTDNGVYDLGSVDAHYPQLSFSNGEEAFVYAGDRAVVDNLRVVDCQLAGVGLQNADDLFIKDYYVRSTHSSRPPIAQTRNGNINSTNFRIGHLNYVGNNGSSLMDFETGALSGLQIDGGDIEITHDASSTLLRGIWFLSSTAWSSPVSYDAGDIVQNNGLEYVCILTHVSSASDEPGVGANTATYWELSPRYVRLRDLQIRLIDNESGVANNYSHRLPSLCAVGSYMNNVRTALVDTFSDGSQHRWTGAFQDNMSLLGEYNMQSNQTYIREDGAYASRKVMVAGAAPTVGTWKVGDMVWSSAAGTGTDAGSPGGPYVVIGWRCTVAGTPGTWVALRCFTGDIT